MKFYRWILAAVLGALSAEAGWMLYVAWLFWRYPLPIPSLNLEVWALFFGVPAAAGAVVGLAFPVWQRAIHIQAALLRPVALWMVVAWLILLGQAVVLDSTEAWQGLLALDSWAWLVSGAVSGLCLHLLRIMTGEAEEAEAVALGKLRHMIGFRNRTVPRMRGIAMVFDLEGFTAFFNQPWAQNYVPRYLDLVFSAVSIELLGGRRFWGDKQRVPAFLHPVHQKFLGDGALCIWTPQAGKENFSDAFVVELIRRLQSLERQFPDINAACVGPIPSTFTLPARIRVGIAAGSIYELTRKGTGEKEYMGFCINLASRLQGYCPELALLISSRLKVPEAVMDELNLVRVTATSIRGFSQEELIVDRSDYGRLSRDRKRRLFQVDAAPVGAETDRGG